MIPLKTFRNLPKIKQDRITSAAVEEFSDKGYSGASINSLVERLGIAKGSIFQYFGDKKGLFLFVFDKTTDMVKNYLRTVRDQTADKDLFTRLEATLLAGVFFIKEHPIIYRLYLKTLFEYDIPFRNEILQSLREYSLKYLHSLLETAKERGELREDVDIDKASFVLDAIMDRFLQAQSIPHLDAGLGLYKCDEETARRWVAQLMDILRLGLGISDCERVEIFQDDF
jgi:AcrR family transcriptional regulator